MEYFVNNRPKMLINSVVDMFFFQFPRKLRTNLRVSVH
ncbi:hypothetical protein Clopa_0421 [Clostridium pasteurianum BC1]|uniref:Uncharacterized protein n=1 Tax=Clostridium pasteurianum BC1 TaxID=86416 RepID=R4K146_CLOPA|nr:hypothetical protein Clopa_0421 [Clostridium pasteurianum BC1]